MACCESRTTVVSNNRGQSIAELLKKIDKMQKEAILSSATSSCDTCRFNVMYNTKPISIYFGNGNRFAAVIPNSEDLADIFRIEEVRGNETIVLRLLVVTDGEIVCTENTVVLNIDCICGVQCFESINCDLFCF